MAMISFRRKTMSDVLAVNETYGAEQTHGYRRERHLQLH